MSGIAVEVSVEDGDWGALGDVETLSRRAVEAALRVAPGAPTDDVEVSLLLTGDEEMRVLNRGWRGQDKPTNVLSFPAPSRPGTPGPRPLGDIALAHGTLRREAEEEGKALDAHFTHLVIHGTLHLIGCDHETAPDAQAMEALETEALRTLGIADPYAGTEPAEG